MHPSVSFILATHNRGPVLIDCLRKTLSCGLPVSQFSISVIDNASTDDTPRLVQSLASAHPNIHLIPLPKNFGPVAKNFAIHNNPADILVLLDDDAYPLPGAVPQMLRHFHDDPRLAAAVFDVTLPDGSKEASAYPDVFIGAGTALRNSILKTLPNRGLLPHDYFMQAEEYDLSFRILAARDEQGSGYSIQRFWDMPLMHLKNPAARIAQRTTRLDVRNNLYLLAKYLPEPLCHQFAADWLARYWLMATGRDQNQSPHPIHGTHKQAFIRGAAQGLAEWTTQRAGGRLVLPPHAVERIFKFDAILDRLTRVKQKLNLKRIAFADLGKNILAFHRAAETLSLRLEAILDDNLAATSPNSTPAKSFIQTPTPPSPEYRGIPIINQAAFSTGPMRNVDALVLTNLSPVHAQRRAAALRRVLPLPVIDLFSRRDSLLHGSTGTLPTAPETSIPQFAGT